MKYTGIVAASALLGSASAGVHKAKLQKVPLSDQFVRLTLILDRRSVACQVERCMPQDRQD